MIINLSSTALREVDEVGIWHRRPDEVGEVDFCSVLFSMRLSSQNVRLLCKVCQVAAGIEIYMRDCKIKTCGSLKGKPHHARLKNSKCRSIERK